MVGAVWDLITCNPTTRVLHGVQPVSAVVNALGASFSALVLRRFHQTLNPGGEAARGHKVSITLMATSVYWSRNLFGGVLHG